MKFALSTLSNSVMMFTLMALAASNLASANENDIESPNQVTPINDADNQSNIQKSYAKNKTIATNSEIEISQQQPNLKTLVDPTTHKNINSSYSLEVPSLLSLEQAQNILLQVSPKLAANQAAIASSEYQTDALDTLDNPLVFARVSATAYNLDTDLDLSSLKSGVVNEADSLAPYFPNLPNLGELADERIPDSYEFLKRSGSTSGAGVGVLWPIYTAGRTTALTSASEARTQEAIADSLLDKNELYNTLIEQYSKRNWPSLPLICAKMLMTHFSKRIIWPSDCLKKALSRVWIV